MKNVLFLILAASVAACTGPRDDAAAQEAAHRTDGAAGVDLASGRDAGAVDLSGVLVDLGRAAVDLAGSQADLAHQTLPLPPQSCDQRHAGVTAVIAVIAVDNYGGVQHGRNGDHEIIDGTITTLPFVYDATIIDTHNVHLAMNVHSSIDPSGLPMAIPVSPGDTLEVEGEYIPASTANASNGKGAASVIHYTHAPCGFVIIGGATYN